MLMWHRQLQLIDHGAAFYFHHGWSDDWLDRSQDRFALIKDHVLLPFADQLAEADRYMAAKLASEIVFGIVAAIPDSWLLHDAPFATADEHREAYARYLLRRLQSPRDFIQEAQRARSLLV
jgi:hypothetical protein